MAAQTDIERLTDAVNKLTNQLRGGSGGGGSSGGGGGGFGFNPLSNGMKSAATASEYAGDAISKLGSGTMTTRDALSTFNNALSNFGGSFGKILGDAGKVISEAMLTTNKNLNDTSNFGATFNNNIAEFDYLIKGARMTQDEYTEMVKKGAQELAALGSTVNRAQKNFLEMTEALHQRPIIAQLEKLGMSADTINKAMYVASLGQPGFNANDPLARQRQIDATERLIESIDENSRITGIGRKEQLEKLQQQKTEGHYIAAQYTMNNAQKAALDAIQPLVNSMGPAFQTVFKQGVVSGGVTNEAGTRAAATLGMTGGLKEVLEAANAVRNAKTAEDVQKAKDAFYAAAAAQANQMSDKSVAQLSAMELPGNTAQSDAYKEYESQFHQKIKAKEAEAKATGETIDEKEAIRRILAEVHNEAAGLTAAGEENKESSAKLATTINEIDRNLKAAAGGLSSQFGNLANAAGRAIQHIDQSILDSALKNRSQKGWEQAGADLVKKLEDTLKTFIPDDLKSRYELGKKMSNQITNPEQSITPIEDVPPKNQETKTNEQKTKEPEGSFADGTPNFEKFLSGNSTFSGMFDQFDPKGTPVELHGKELVANEEQMIRFIEKLMPPSMFKQLSPGTNASYSSSSSYSSGNTSSDSKIQDTFNHVTEQMEKVTNHLHEVADKLKNISFVPNVEQFNDQIMAVFKNINGTITGNITEKHSRLIDYNPLADKKKADEKAAKEREEQENKNKPIIEFQPKSETTKPTSSKVEAPPSTYPTDAIKTVENTPPVESAKPKTAGKPGENPADPEAGLKDARDEFTNAELKELETGIQSKETLERKVRESDNKFYIDKIAEMKGRTDEDAVHDLPIFEAQYAAFKPKYDAETAAAARMRELTLAAEKKQREQEEGKTSTPEPNKTEKATIKTAPVAEESAADKTKALNTDANKEITKTEPSMHAGLSELSDKLTASVSTNIVKPEDNTDKLTSAMETFKSPDYSASFNNIDTKLGVANLNDESKKQADASQPPPMTDADGKQVPITENRPESGFFDKLGNLFSSDNRPLASRGNVRYEAVKQETPEENAAKLAAENTPEAIAKRKADPNDPANIYREHVRNSGMYKHDDLWKSIVKEDSYKKPAQPTETAAPKPAAHHIGGLESWQEFNARKDAEQVKNSHAQIKDVAQQQVVPSTHELTNKPAPAPKALEPAPTQPQPAAAPSASAAHTVSLKEIYDAVMQLNKTMAQMASHTESISSSSSKQNKLTAQGSNRTY